MSNGSSADNSGWAKFQQKILASRFLTISLLVHVLIVTFFGGTVLFNKYVEPPDFAAEGEGFLSSDVQVTPPPPDNPLDTQTPTFTPAAPPPVAVSMSAITTTNLATQSFTMNAMPVTAPTVSNAITGKVSSATKTLSTINSSLPGAMAGRGSDRRGAALREGGGKEKSELAVMKALQWLKATQNPDGTWGKKYRGAMTGLALLSFLGHGETQNSPEFGKTVIAGIESLIKEGTKSQGHLAFYGNGWENPRRPTADGAYQHAIATYALGEAYTMTKDERITSIFKQAINYIIAGQRSDGGWAYKYNLSPDPNPKTKVPYSDTSVSGWQVQALKAAKFTELPIDKLHETMDKSLNNFERVFDEKSGEFGYNTPTDIWLKGVRRHSLAGAGVLCVALTTGKKSEKMIREGLKAIIRGDKVDYKAPNADLYAWYYNTQACFMTKEKWSTWNQMFQDQIVDNQGQDGSWPATGGIGGGNMNDATVDAQIYRTGLCVLMLEVYYRYLPTTK